VTTYSKITVIGGAGFVGTNLCQKLADRQIDFEILDLRKSLRFADKCKIADVRELSSLRAAVTGDAVVNLAAIHRDDVRDKTEYYRTNVTGAENVVKICNEKNIKKIVFTSSVAVYGYPTVAVGEAGEIRPFNEYGKTKYLAEERLRDWERSGDASLIIVRPTVIFGEGNRGNVYNLLRQIARRNFIMIGSGKNIKSMAYIGNLVAFLDVCIETERKYAVYNYVDTPDLDMNSLVRHAQKNLRHRAPINLRIPIWFGLILGYIADGASRISGKRFPLSSIRVRKFCSSTSFSSAKLDLDGFTPPFELLEGINRTISSEFIFPDPNREVFFTE
jgi:nucleoside-diphosphate-sugar epimerase